MIEITGPVALILLGKAVREKGADYVYVNPKGLKAGTYDDDMSMVANCYYLHDVDGKNVPGCIVGHVAKLVGVSDGILRMEENNTSDALIDRIHVSETDNGHQRFKFDGAATALLRAAQSAQDAGKTWGQALAQAREAFVTHVQVYPKREEQEVLVELGVW